MANLPLAFGEIVVGGVILMAGLSGKSIGQVMNGQFTLAGFGSSSSGTSSTGGTSSGTGNSTSTGSGSGAPVIGSVTRAMLEAIGAAHGWSGQQITDWENVISAESGGNPNAVNSSSGAYGIAQMLATGGSPSNLGPNKAKYAAYGGNANSVQGQLTGMAGYISQVYGNPTNAWAHEQANHWY